MAIQEKKRRELRSRIEASIEEAHVEYQNKLKERRNASLQLAAISLREKRLTEAAKELLTYLRILEMSKGVGIDQLNPTHFDQKSEAADLLILAGVHWDLMRIYDRMYRNRFSNELKMAIEKYIIFTKGAPHQPVCTEILRKYIQKSRCVHMNEFRSCYTRITGKEVETKCFIATAQKDFVKDDTIQTLQDFRDFYLRRRIWGIAFTKFYYLLSPPVAEISKLLPVFLRKKIASFLDKIAQRVAHLIN